MGRNIYWKSFIIIILLISSSVLFSEPLPVRQNITVREIHNSMAIKPRNGMGSELSFSFPYKMNDAIQKQILFFSTPEKLQYLQRALDRAAPFREHILSLIEEYDIPKELFYLPILESAYRVDAVSRSGAVGMWQFMENSIAPYNITISDWQDDRRDFWKSTEGALKKLIYNYEKTGSWELALASYNCGLNRIRRTIRSSGIDNYWELVENRLLPSETANYIPKFIAISYICSRGGRFGLERKWEKEISWERITLDRSVDLRMVSLECNIDYNLLAIGNAELFYDVTPPADSGYKLKIPSSIADSVNNILKNSDTKFMEFYRYSIKTGDTLSEISEYYEVPLNMIYRYNKGISPRYLRTGQTVIIPALIKIDPFRSDEIREINFDENYIVQKGDSLWSISGKFGITPELLALQNRLPVNGTLNIGIKLSVPVLE